jgi:hypothetical protein
VSEPLDEEDTSPPLVGQRPVETATLAILLAFAALMLGGACLYGLVVEFMKRGTADAVFVQRDQFKRVLQVFVPTLLYLPATEWLGLYVASFLLIAGFMYWVGRLKPWISIVTALVFSVAMFVTFEIAFDVLMPKGPLERLLGY